MKAQTNKVVRETTGITIGHYAICKTIASINDFLNEAVGDDEIASLKRIRFEGIVRHSDTNGEAAFCLYLVAATTAPATASIASTANESFEQVLETALGGQGFGYTRIAGTAIPFLGSGSTIINGQRLYSIQGTYNVPKGAPGVFNSDEHLDEPEMRTFLVLMGKRAQAGAAVGDCVVEGMVSLSFNQQRRSVGLAEL